MVQVGIWRTFSDTPPMPTRPGWATALLLACGCGDVPDPAWLLGDTPRILAFRVEVTRAGPVSAGLLPIPADRVRSQPLPGDTVELSAWIANAAGEIATEDVEPVWHLCPRTGSCIESLHAPQASRACEDAVPERVACRVGAGARPQFTIPPLDVTRPLEDQVFLRLAMVGAVDPSLGTERCIEIISDPAGPDWTGCIVGYRNIILGPFARLATHAAQRGIELPDEVWPDPPQTPVVPTFNPEVPPLVVAPYYGTLPPDLSRAVRVEPGGTAVLEPDAVYLTASFRDPKDTQTVVELEPDGVLNSRLSQPTRVAYTATPDILAFSISRGWQIWTPSEPTSFSVHTVFSDRLGGAAWATFRFEVAGP